MKILHFISFVILSISLFAQQYESVNKFDPLRDPAKD